MVKGLYQLEQVDKVMDTNMGYYEAIMWSIKIKGMEEI
jgi:hypothetical protein